MKEGTFMIVDERLAVHRALARVRVVEDVNFALEETEPSKAGIEEALQDQIGDGRQLLEMAEAACYLASVTRLRPDTHKHMLRALTDAVQAFQDLREMVANWMRQHNVSLAGEQKLDPLIAKMEQFRAELASSLQERQRDTAGDHVAFPQVGTAEWGEMNRKRAELIRKNIRGELSESEREEYETLQRLSLAAVEGSFSRQGDAKREDNSEANGG
jgi:hypothetical protein